VDSSDWKNVLKVILKYTNDNFLLISGELGGDWEACFSPYKSSEFNEWRQFFLEIWEKYPTIPNTLRDYRYKNLPVLHSFLGNKKIKIQNFIECPIDINVKTNEHELLEHIKLKIWSPFIQNISNSRIPFENDNFSKEDKYFLSKHIINIFKLQK
jgi:hypothetical protein